MSTTENKKIRIENTLRQLRQNVANYNNYGESLWNNSTWYITCFALFSNRKPGGEQLSA